MGRASWVTTWAHGNHRVLIKGGRPGIRKRERLKDAMLLAGTKNEPQAKDCRQPLEAGQGKRLPTRATGRNAVQPILEL